MQLGAATAREAARYKKKVWSPQKIKVNVLRKTRTNRLSVTANYTVKTTSWISYQEHTSDQSPGRQHGGAG